MLHNLKPYPAYKDSGVPWLGEMPENWEIKRLKHISTLHGRIGFHGLSSSDYGSDGIIVVSGSNFRDWHVEWNRCHRISEDWYEKDKNIQLKNGDLLVTKDGTIGKTAIVNELIEKAVLNSGVIVVRPKMPIQYENRYLLYLINSKVFDAFIDIKKTGATIHHLYEATFNNFSISLPPLSEQSTIVRYLDYIDRRIRRYIRTKQKLIKLLEEQKQAIIHQAVTRGLDPNVKLKPSGVEWLGEIPEHWEIVALKQLCSLLRDGTHLPPARQSIGVPLLSVRNIVGGRFVNRDDDSFISFSDYEQLCRSFVVQQNDVLLAIVGATLGKVAIVPAMSTFHIQRSLAIFRPKRHKLFYDYLAFFLRGPAFQRALWKTVAFSAQPGIYLSTLGAFRIAVPPLAEQKQIVLKVSQHTEQVQQAIDKARCEISLLREYRTRLIADVVTGKLDVREVAANLPEETDEKESFEDSLAEDDELENNEIEDEQAGELEEEVPA